MQKFLLFTLTLLVLISCKDQPDVIDLEVESTSINSSDPDALLLADQIMEAMGGNETWEAKQFFKWTFFERRTHIWDKKNQIVKIDIPSQEMEYLLKMDDMTGTVKKSGQIMQHQDSINLYLDRAKKMWINDSYWLFMPFKLKDPGVTLKILSPDTTQLGIMADKIEMTFSDVGVTPDNKYVLYVNQDEKLISQWDFYTNYNDSLPRFQSAWPDYRSYNGLKLSGGRINGNGITNIVVSDDLSDELVIK